MLAVYWGFLSDVPSARICVEASQDKGATCCIVRLLFGNRLPCRYLDGEPAVRAFASRPKANQPLPRRLNIAFPKGVLRSIPCTNALERID